MISAQALKNRTGTPGGTFPTASRNVVRLRRFQGRAK
jgi:hypothetical protein